MKVCIVDLNNFASYPTISVGIIVAVLRKAGVNVDVFSPLAFGVKGVQREARVPRYGLMLDRLSYRSAVSDSAIVSTLRRKLASRRRSGLLRQSDHVARRLAAHLDQTRPDAVLISTYLMYGPLCEAIAKSCRQRDIPVLIGGQYFVHPKVLDEWVQIDGVSAVVGGEVEADLPEIVRCVAQHEDLSRFPGVSTAADTNYTPAPPLTDLDSVPYPDYRDFEWQEYRTPIVPMITGRGCAWGVCTFCSDVTSAAGRTYRSRSIDNVLGEIEHQSTRHDTGQFVFTDLKLNSNPTLWHGLIANIKRVRPDAKWIGAVHIGSTGQDCLTPEHLADASQAGMVRLTTGLESGSQTIVDSMRKGTDLSHTSKCLDAAHRAGISVRVTLIVGYPGETTADVHATARYIAQHQDSIERVRLNRFQIVIGTKIHEDLVASPRAFPDISNLQEDRKEALVDHHHRMTEDRQYRRAMDDLLGVVHRVNRKPLRAVARAFDGVM